jgi:uncharacterized protein DUF4386
MPDSTHVVDRSQRTAAKVVGLACLVPFTLVVTANFGLRGGLYVRDDMAETLRRVAQAEPIFRLSMAFDMAYCVGVAMLTAALYVVLSPVSRHMAMLASVLKLVYGITAVLMVLGHLNVLRLATDPLYARTPEPVQALAKLNFSAIGMEYYVGLAFWALSATIFAWLWLESGYIPKALAVFGLISSAWCAFCAFAYIINPGFARVVNLWWFDSPFAVFDISLSFWLLFRGLRAPGGLSTAPSL